jgi:hypothetical protein
MQEMKLILEYLLGCLFFLVLAYAVRRRSTVRASFKIASVQIFLEATDKNDDDRGPLDQRDPRGASVRRGSSRPQPGVEECRLPKSLL